MNTRLRNLLDIPTVTNERDWQMSVAEQAVFAMTLNAIRPSEYWEIGVHFGGSLECASYYSGHCTGFDIEDVSERFSLPSNCSIIVGDSRQTLPERVRMANAGEIGMPTVVLVDGNHNTDSVFADVSALLELNGPGETLILMHDSGNPSCRVGIERALRLGATQCPRLITADLDWLIARIIEFGGGLGEVWGGFALALLGNRSDADSVAEVRSSSVSTNAINAVSAAARNLQR